MLDREIAERPEQQANDVDFHRWVLDRRRGRAARLISLLLALLIASFAVVAFLLTQQTDATEPTQKDAATRQELADLERRFEELDQRFREVAVNLRTANRRAARLTSCLEKRVVKVTRGIHALLADRISLQGYLRRYEPVGCP